MATKKLVITSNKVIEISTETVWVVTEYDPCYGKWTQTFAKKEDAEECFRNYANEMMDDWEETVDDYDNTVDECVECGEIVMGDKTVTIEECDLR